VRIQVGVILIILFARYAEAVRAQDVLSVGIDAVVPKGGKPIVVRKTG
jgi:hypothetical protein